MPSATLSYTPEMSGWSFEHDHWSHGPRLQIKIGAVNLTTILAKFGHWIDGFEIWPVQTKLSPSFFLVV